jgi:hypothetical protein
MIIIRIIVATSLLTLGLSVARAQESSAGENIAHTQKTPEATTRNNVQGNASDKRDYPSGFNSGPTEPYVKGCVGPISYCNIYFGS